LEVACWTVCGNFVEFGWLILPQKAIPHNTRSCTLTISQTTDWKMSRWPLMPSVGGGGESRVSLWSAANRMWLAQFVCTPQFFKTSKGLCEHTVH
jgi:hypothetical protein